MGVISVCVIIIISTGSEVWSKRSHNKETTTTSPGASSSADSGYLEESREEYSSGNVPPFIILMRNTKHKQNLRQGEDKEVIDFFPFCGEACLDLEGECDINRRACWFFPERCIQCDMSKKKCIEKCLRIVNYH